MYTAGKKGGTMATGSVEFGRQLREVRELRGLSLKGVADPADISAAYLQKLERGDVKDPSPHILHRLSGVLDVPYADLMRLANYVVPRDVRQEEASDSEGINLLAHALNSKEFEGLSAKELEELARYLRWYRHDRESRTG
jgi:transcriptional regulator with XRE-family HTH domain